MNQFTKAFGASVLLAAIVGTPLHGITLHGPQTFDNDDMADLSVYNYGNGWWYNLESNNGSNTPFMAQWGWKSDALMPVPADYDGDGIVDRAVYALEAGNWYIEQSGSSNAMLKITYGAEDAVAVPADYDGDGTIDLALYKPKDGVFYIRESRGTNDPVSVTIEWGGKNLVPVCGYYDNTNKANVAVYDHTKGRWYIRSSTSGALITRDWGWKDLQAVPADYDNDGFTDLAVYSYDTGKWYIQQSGNGNAMRMVQFGWSGTAPVPDDYDGDGIIDIALYKRSNGWWYIQQSSATPTLQQRSGADPIRSENWGWRDAYPTHLQYMVTRWFFHVASQQDHLPIIYPADFNGTLWKTPNHSGDGTVVLLASSYMADYQAGLWAGMVVSSDPAGQNVIGGSLGYGRIVAPYHERPAIRFDAVGTYYGSSPVYMVLIYKDGRRQPWYIPNPGVRTE